jgi:uncharacterized protein YceK
MKSLLTITLFASLSGLTGCGTLLSLGEKDAPPYGGVRMESKIIAQGVPLGTAAWTGDIDIPSLWPLALMDLPFSLIGDTLTLTITVASAIQRQRANQLQGGTSPHSLTTGSSP